MKARTLMWCGAGLVAAYYVGLITSCGPHICVGATNTPMADGRQQFTPAGYLVYQVMMLTRGGFA